MADYAFGIDLGTTYSCIAYADADGKPFVLKNTENESTTPSVVQFNGDEVVVGKIAKENAVLEPETTASFAKRLIGKSDVVLEADGRRISPEEVSAHVLRKLAHDAGLVLGTEVKNVVITCPAYFGAAERAATREAGRMAGLNVLQIINEPTAAALFYGCTRVEGERTVLVYDLGGGTFDVTIIRVAENEIRVVATDGNHDLGGKNWDDVVVEYFKNRFIEQEGDVAFDAAAMQDIMQKAESAKQMLTYKAVAKATIDVDGIRQRIELTREKFDDLTLPLVEETLDLTRRVIEAAGERGVTHIDDFLLVGGSSYMPQIKAAIQRAFPEFEPQLMDPDEAVAKGAALQSMANLVEIVQAIEDVQQSNPGVDAAQAVRQKLGGAAAKVDVSRVAYLGGQISTPKLFDITSKSFAIHVMADHQPKCYNMILRNDAVPCDIVEEFGTYEENMTSVDLKLYENSYDDKYFDVDESLCIGTLVLEGLPPNLPKNAPIEVRIGLDREGSIVLSGLDKTGGRTIEGTFHSDYAMTKEMREAAQTYIENSTLSE